MPFVRFRTNLSVTPEQEEELKKELGETIALIPGKSEAYLLVTFEEKCHLWLRGRNDLPAVYIEAAVFGEKGHRGYDAFTARTAMVVSRILGVNPENIYIRFEDIPAWGVAGYYMEAGQ